MKLLHGFEAPELYRGGFVSIGNYDGVHRGHQAMVAKLVERARAAGVPAVVFTFEPHPIRLLRPQQAPPSLSTLDRKAELLAACGIDCLIAYPTDWELLRLTPQEFFERIIRTELQATGLVEGPNFFFGHNRAGNVETLRQLCQQADVDLEVVSPLKIGSQMVSSSRIRRLIAEGAIAEAVKLLGHPYRIRGRVGAGAGRGRRLGFPTANLQ
ncbi:MAG: bifunctional riboflavin kinase/FAD synthetase, partial [Planctomycetes bacterium]|nr:bifunctional riboflavin kinase/FAD synthetase [Planctomycetota bacterium]